MSNMSASCNLSYIQAIPEEVERQRLRLLEVHTTIVLNLPQIMIKLWIK